MSMNTMETVENEQWVMGTRCRTLVGGVETNRKVAIVEITAAGIGVGVPTHVHEREDETFHIIEGKVRFVLDGREVIASPGQTVFGPRGIEHSWEVIEPAKFIVSVTPSGLEEMFVDLDALGDEQADLAKVSDVCARYAIHFR